MNAAMRPSMIATMRGMSEPDLGRSLFVACGYRIIDGVVLVEQHEEAAYVEQRPHLFADGGERHLATALAQATSKYLCSN